MTLSAIEEAAVAGVDAELVSDEEEPIEREGLSEEEIVGGEAEDEEEEFDEDDEDEFDDEDDDEDEDDEDEEDEDEEDEK
jgi:hypothetical protein